jgi:hypothetical protein
MLCSIVQIIDFVVYHIPRFKLEKYIYALTSRFRPDALELASAAYIRRSKSQIMAWWEGGEVCHTLESATCRSRGPTVCKILQNLMSSTRRAIIAGCFFLFFKITTQVTLCDDLITQTVQHKIHANFTIQLVVKIWNRNFGYDLLRIILRAVYI